MTLGTGTEGTPITDIAFWVIAVSTVVGAIAVVQSRDLFRAALFLVMSFLGVAALFVLLRAEFLAVVQVLIYVGAISVLIIFAILMTRDVQRGSPTHGLQIPAALLAGLLFAAVAFVVLNTDWNLLDDAVVDGTLSAKTVEMVGETYADSVQGIAGLLLRDFVLAFEVASVLLLAAVIGALVLIRER
jgi:NADH-quinone oxidoreductase subunit J